MGVTCKDPRHGYPIRTVEYVMRRKEVLLWRPTP